jgi:alpha-glucosidase
MNDQLHDLGYKVLGYLHPNLRDLSPHGGPAFTAAAAPDLLIKHSDGSPYVNRLGSSSLDLSDPRAIDWWRASVQAVLRDYDFDGWMQDFGEQAPEDGVYASGLPGVDEHNLYPVRYAQATYEAATAVKPDFVTFARSAYVGSTPYLRLSWPGDQSVDWSKSNGLPAQIPAMLSGAISGIPDYAPDVAGYYDPDAGPLSVAAEKELWMRWVELGALSPTFRDMLGARHTQNVNLWTDAETLEHFRTYAQLHNRLVPYIYSVARDASERGSPIMRHLFLEYPDDPNTYALDDQYLVGDSLLVCPVVTPSARDRLCYLPAGEWVDYWTGQAYSGAAYVTLPAPIERLPLLIRAGALLPTSAATIETLAPVSRLDSLGRGADLTLRVAPHPGTPAHTSELRLYDETLLRYAATPAHATLEILGSAARRSLSLELPCHGRPFDVMVSGERRRLELRDSGERAASTRGDWYDSASDTLHLNLLIEAGASATVSW